MIRLKHHCYIVPCVRRIILCVYLRIKNRLITNPFTVRRCTQLSRRRHCHCGNLTALWRFIGYRQPKVFVCLTCLYFKAQNRCCIRIYGCFKTGLCRLPNLSPFAYLFIIVGKGHLDCTGIYRHLIYTAFKFRCVCSVIEPNQIIARRDFSACEYRHCRKQHCRRR